MASYALQMQKVPVRLVTLTGADLRGELFLHASVDQAGRLQTIGGKLEEEDARFLPLGSDGGVQLVRVNWIAYLEVVGPTPDVTELEEIGACRATVELELVNGETLSGDLRYLLPPGNNRVSDLLNSPRPAFLLLAGAGLTRYVQRDALARVRA